MHFFSRSEITTFILYYICIASVFRPMRNVADVFHFGRNRPIQTVPDRGELQSAPPNFYQYDVKFFRCTWEIIVAPLSPCNDFVFHIESRFGRARQHFDINSLFENVLFFEMRAVYNMQMKQYNYISDVGKSQLQLSNGVLETCNAQTDTTLVSSTSVRSYYLNITY